MSFPLNRVGLPIVGNRPTRRVSRVVWNGFDSWGEPRYREAWVIEAGQPRQRHENRPDRLASILEKSLL